MHCKGVIWKYRCWLKKDYAGVLCQDMGSYHRYKSTCNKWTVQSDNFCITSYESRRHSSFDSCWIVSLTLIKTGRKGLSDQIWLLPILKNIKSLENCSLTSQVLNFKRLFLLLETGEQYKISFISTRSLMIQGKWVIFKTVFVLNSYFYIGFKEI